MQAQRGAEFDPHIGKPFCQFTPVLFEVLDDVRTGGEEVREKFDRGCAGGDAIFGSARDARFRQFQIGSLDNREKILRAEGLCQPAQVVIRLGTSAAVGDQENGGGHVNLTGDNRQRNKILAGSDRRFLRLRRQNHVHKEVQELPQ